MRRGQDGLPGIVEAHFGAQYVAIASYDGLGVGVPHDELLVGLFHRVELIEVAGFARAASCRAERNLAQASYLAAHVRRCLPRDDVNFVARFVGETKAAVLGQLTFEDIYRYWRYNLFHIVILAQISRSESLNLHLKA